MDLVEMVFDPQELGRGSSGVVDGRDDSSLLLLRAEALQQDIRCLRDQEPGRLIADLNCVGFCGARARPLDAPVAKVLGIKQGRAVIGHGLARLMRGFFGDHCG